MSSLCLHLLLLLELNAQILVTTPRLLFATLIEAHRDTIVHSHSVTSIDLFVFFRHSFQLLANLIWLFFRQIDVDLEVIVKDGLALFDRGLLLLLLMTPA